MGKKNKNESEMSAKSGKKGRVPFCFLDYRFDTIDLLTVKRHIFFLICASLVAKFLVIVLTTSVFRSFIDLFDIGIYFKHAMMLIQGQMPYNSEFGYPILVFIPMMIAIVRHLSWRMPRHSFIPSRCSCFFVISSQSSAYISSG